MAEISLYVRTHTRRNLYLQLILSQMIMIAVPSADNCSPLHLEIITENGKDKRVWHDQPRRGHKNVKAPNQIKARFAELFPKIKWHKETLDPTRKGQLYLSGISISEASEPVSEAVGELG